MPTCPYKDDHGIRTKQEVAQMLGVSRAAIYQAEKHFLRKLRRAVLADPVLRQTAIDLHLFTSTGGSDS